MDLLDLLPAWLADLAYEAMARGLHVAAAAVGTAMLIVALTLAVLLQRRDELLDVAADQRVARGEHQPPRVRPELGSMAGCPVEHGAAMLGGGMHRQHDRRQANAELGGRGLVVGEVDDQRGNLVGRGRRPEHADGHGAAQAQIGVLGQERCGGGHALMVDAEPSERKDRSRMAVMQRRYDGLAEGR